MDGKRDKLRQGDVVELKPGLKGRLNFENQDLELSDGRRLPISDKDKQELFSTDEKVLSHARKKEKIERSIQNVPGGEFLHQLGNKGVLGGVSDWGNRLVRSADDYLENKRAQQEVSERISEESPWTSGAATAASFIPDIALTRGMSAVKAAPLITAVSAGSRAIDEPSQVLGEVALAGALGFGVDKATGWLGKVAQRRGEVQSLAGRQAEVTAKNLATETEAKAAQNLSKSRVANENSAQMHQYNLEVNARQNKMIESQNSYEKAKALHAEEMAVYKSSTEKAKQQTKSALEKHKTEVANLKEQAKIAEKNYEKSLRELPQVQRKAQQEFSEGVKKAYGEIEKEFPVGSKINTSDLEVWKFYNNYVKENGLIGPRKDKQTENLFRTLFPNGKDLSPKEFSVRLKNLESALENASPEKQRMLVSLKQHIGDRMPVILEDSIAHQKIMGLVEKDIQNDITKAFSKMKGVDPRIVKSIRENSANLAKTVSGKDFLSKLQDGQLTEEILQKIAKMESFAPGLSAEDLLKISSPTAKKEWVNAYKGILTRAEQQQQQFISSLSENLNNTLAKHELGVIKEAGNSSQKVRDLMAKTYGSAEPVPIPSRPVNPEFPNVPQEIQFNGKAPIAPVPQESIPMPLKPTAIQDTSYLSNNQLNLQEMPSLSNPEGLAGKVGDFLEKPKIKSEGMPNLLKLGALKYALGSAALPLKAATALGKGAVKGLTLPGDSGEMARLTFKQAGIQAIEAIAQTYPSYHNGVLDNPQERRSLTKQVEDDPEIPPEQKAIIQSKINRGKPLSLPL